MQNLKFNLNILIAVLFNPTLTSVKILMETVGFGILTTLMSIFHYLFTSSRLLFFKNW